MESWGEREEHKKAGILQQKYKSSLSEHKLWKRHLYKREFLKTPCVNHSLIVYGQQTAVSFTSFSSVTNRALTVWKTNEAPQIILIGEMGGLRDAQLIYVVYNTLFGSNASNDQNK